MAGHSKWANIKHRKERQDKKRGKLFSKLSKMIAVAAREKGGNPDKNPDLAMAMEKAKDANMPKENIQRAIKRGTGELEGVDYKKEIMEAYGPSGSGFIIKTLTDNKNRTLSEIRGILKEHGGSLAQKNAVSWKFEQKGKLVIRTSDDFKKENLIDKVIEAGAQDFEELEDGIIVYTEPQGLHQVKKSLKSEGVAIEETSFSQEPKTLVEVKDVSKAKTLVKLSRKLEEHDDVEAIYSDFDIPEEIVEKVA